MKRLKIAIPPVVAAGGCALILAVSGDAQAPAGTTIELKEIEGPSTNIDNAPKKKFSQGDSFVFKNKLQTPSGEAAGTDGGTCVAFDASKKGGAVTCNVSLLLHDGTISVAGPIKFTQGRNFDAAVVGGTGAYEGANGSMHVVEHRDSADLTVHMLP